jgi:aspartyl-tRNA(Asn)/glutamyl-tRNA(Gln) amidotransferase subunit A
MDLEYLSITEAHELLAGKKVSAVTLVQYYLDQIAKHDSKIKACLYVRKKNAIKQAERVDAKIAAGKEIGLLEGIPYTAKDMFLTAHVPTTAASKILAGFVPPHSATVIEKLNVAGAILLAKVNQDEFAHGGSTENSAYQKTANPWNKNHVPGGSSGGSAAAVAADFGIFSLGTDTGGSIRQPASYCGVTGLKPTYGTVSRYGVIAMASSFDCIGPLTRSAEDAAIVMSVIAGRDAMDSTTIDSNLSSSVSALEDNLKIGVAKGFESHLTVEEAKTALQEAGHTLGEVDLPDGNLALAAYYVLVPAEISSNLERYDGVRYGARAKSAGSLHQMYNTTRDEFFGAEVKRRNLTGTYSLSAGYYDAYYEKAMKIRSIIRAEFEALFAQHDFIITPTTLTAAFAFGAKADPVQMYKEDVLTVSANLAGLPAISVPAGINKDTQLPLGLQIIGPQGSDTKVMALAAQFQKVTNWHQRRPKP